MEEKLSETGNPLIDVETNIENHNNIMYKNGHNFGQDTASDTSVRTVLHIRRSKIDYGTLFTRL